jgi:MerR family copper efflux transcriptional regulator
MESVPPFILPNVDSPEGRPLRSGELARLAGVSKDTLRHYERIGVLPEAERTDSRYRLYPATALRRVLVARAALELGISLRELAEIFAMRDSGQPPCDEVRQLARKRLTAVDKQIESLILLRDHISSLLQNWDKRLSGLPAGEYAHLLETLVPEPEAQSAPCKAGK